ncbi:hypothetical protein KKF59_02865 [Patescibacteria group bacterium]|nr:hypothetical protein [Patescibacteria group bacterium]MBU1034261.1 hypothetical protein [Patescibacteria group bacterium]MBU1629757.1 hypothetical protein [Patescibacteria group bacterium]MBU1908050.1 hypothetical protein [Patescibacteria group bacterium]
MIYYYTVPIAILSLAAMVFIIARHWREIRLLDPNSIKEERVRKKRDELITQRFERVKSGALLPLKISFNKAVVAGKKRFHASYIKLIQLDRFYKQAKAPFASMAPSAAERLRALLDEARSLARDLKWADAERRYLEILSMDKRNVEAYKGLAGIYLKQKMHTQAKETFEFLLKIKKADDVCFAGLAEIAEAERDLIAAEQYYRKAVEYRPRLANRHAELGVFYLDSNQPAKAWPFVRRATELEPKSPKYMELSIDAAIKIGNKEEARRRYDKLRLLSEDRNKLQFLKERLDEMRVV